MFLTSYRQYFMKGVRHFYSEVNHIFFCILFVIRILGDEIIYLYSDLKTALIGKFQNGQMVEAKPSRVIRERCHRGIKEVLVAEPKAKSPTLTYHPPNQVQLGNQPKVTDPFDQTQIYIQNTIYGEGVFAKKKIHKGDIIAYYSGLLWNDAEQPLFTQNKTYEEM